MSLAGKSPVLHLRRGPGSVAPCRLRGGSQLQETCGLRMSAATPPIRSRATAATANVSGGEAQRFAEGSDIAADWWTLFHSKPLNELIELSLANNHDLKAAQAALSVARENVLAQRGVYYPSVAADFSASRQRQSGQIAPALNSNAFLYNLFTPQVSVSYVPDVFGLNRRTVESLQAQEQEVRFQMIATYTTLTANVVVTAIQEGSLQMQIDATRQLIDINSNMLQILQYQFAKGYASRLGCGRAGIAARASRRHAAAAPQAAGAAARPAGGSGRPVSEPGAGGEIRAFEPAIAAGTAGEPALGSSWRSVRMCCRPRPTCTTPAPRSASPSRIGCRISY